MRLTGKDEGYSGMQETASFPFAQNTDENLINSDSVKI
jgi:hypothetical protein